MTKSVKPHAARNEQIPSGIMRFSRARMYQIKGVHKKKPFVKKTKKFEKKFAFKVKQVGGEKTTVKERKVPLVRQSRRLDAENEKAQKRGRNRKSFSEHKRKLRSTLTPGTVVIFLAGRHKGKRAVLLKQLKSGLLLVTGPMKLNNLPLRRINQRFVIATKTKLDISGVKIPDSINDEYFKRPKRQRQPKKNADPDIFAKKKEAYEPSSQRKNDQKLIDSQILDLIRKHPEKKFLFGYLGALFSLQKGQYPHQLVF